jgi:hypothetical protein
MTASRFASLTFAPFIGAVLATSCALWGCNTIFGNELGYLAERDAREEDAFDGVDAKFDNVSVDTASADAVYDGTLDGSPIDVPTADAIDVRLGTLETPGRRSTSWTRHPYPMSRPTAMPKSTVVRRAPMPPTDAFSTRAVDAQSFLVCPVQAAAVQCWGGNGSGQVGDGTTSQRPSPVATSGLSSGVTAIGVGNWGNSCALLNTGSVSCWGNNVAGQQGDSTTADVYLPTAVPGLGGVSVASKYTCALAGAGSVQRLGSEYLRAAGRRHHDRKAFPGEHRSLRSASVSAGDAHTCARVSSGKVQCGGSNLHGGLGDGTNTDSYTPKEVSGMAAVSALTVGADHSCALLPTGTVQCWGLGNHGQLGNGVTSDSLTPLTISGLSLFTVPLCP